MLLKRVTGKTFTIAAFCLLVVALSAAFFLFKRHKPLYVIFRQVGIRSSNEVPEVARAGDTVTLSFTLDTTREIDHDLYPVVTINNLRSAVRKSGEVFLARRTLAHEDREGPVSFSIELHGAEGVSYGSISSTTDGSTVLLDRTPPSLEEVIVSTDSRINPAFVPAGGRVFVTIRASEPLGGYPDMRIAGLLPGSVEQLDPASFRAEAVLSENLKAGPLPLRIEYTDRAGNSGPVFTGGTDGEAPELVFDPDPPEITQVGIASTNSESKEVALPGDMVILSFAVSEPPASLPLVEIAGAGNIHIRQIDTIEAPGMSRRHTLFEAAAQMIKPIPPGRVGFTIGVIDMAGNTRVVSNETTDGSSVYFRSADIPPLAMKRASGSPRIPYVGTSYERPERLGYIDALSPEATMDLTIHFSLSIERTGPDREAAREPEVAAPPTPPDEIPAEEPAAAEPVAESPAEAELEEPAAPLPAEEPAPQEPAVTAITSEEVVEQVTADEMPAPPAALDSETLLVIDSPRENSYFGSYVQVTGRVKNPENVVSVSWEVSPLVFLGQQSEFLSGNTEIDEYGVFSFIFATEKLSGSQQVVVTARYADETREEAKLSLLEGESAIPSFGVLPEGESVVVSWEPNPLAASYSIAYREISSGDGEEKTIQNITSPSRIRGLRIGNRYTFQLSAYRNDGGFLGSSSSKEIVALLPETLKPQVSSEYKRIRVTWPEIAGAGSFDLERSVSSDGDFQLIEEKLPGTEYIDTNVSYGKQYFYRVSPAGESSFSIAASGEPLAIPEDRTRVAISWQDIKVSDATVFGNYTFVAAGEDGLVIFDISDPEKPVSVSSIQTTNARDVAVSEGYAYVADSDRGLRVIDIDAPRHPVEVGSRKTSDARSIELRRIDDETIHAVVADGTFGVKILDVSNPKDPERLYSIDTTEANDLVITEADGRMYAVVADGRGGVVVIDLDTPDYPIVSTIPVDNASGLTVEENLLFVADPGKGLIIFDLEDLQNPRELSSYEVERAVDVAVAGDFAYLASEADGLLIFDVKSPMLPVFYDVAKIEGLKAVAVKGTKVFAGGEKGFHFLDAFTRGESYEIASVKTDGKAYEVSVADSAAGRIYAYVADRAGGLKIFDVTMPDTLGESSLAAHIETEYCREVLAVGDYAYIADGDGGLRIVDLTPLWDSDPETRPGIIGTWNTDGNARSVAYNDSLIYMADGNRGVKIIDVTIPTRPTQIGSIRTEYAVNIKVTDGAVFLADGDGGFRIYDADPENPSLLATVDTANTRGVDVNDGIAYVVGSTGLSIIDVSSPAEPSVIGFYETGYAEEVAVEGRLAFVAEGFNGLTIIDVIDPTSPYIVSKSENKYTVGVAVSGKYAFLVDTTGLVIVEILIPDWAMRK